MYECVGKLLCRTWEIIAGIHTHTRHSQLKYPNDEHNSTEHSMFTFLLGLAWLLCSFIVLDFWWSSVFAFFSRIWKVVY